MKWAVIDMSVKRRKALSGVNIGSRHILVEKKL